MGDETLQDRSDWKNDEAVIEWQEWLKEAKAFDRELTTDDRTSLAMHMCLASRSAYFNFYATVLMTDVIDPDHRVALEQLCKESMNVMFDGVYKDVMAGRLQDLQDLCREHMQKIARRTESRHSTTFLDDPLLLLDEDMPDFDLSELELALPGHGDGSFDSSDFRLDHSSDSIFA
jgi:phosphoenolpyruvate-protein kinase (PTS system EI component)